MWYLLLAILLCSSEVFAQGVGPAPGVGLNDEAVVQGRVQIINCAGAGIVCTKSGVTGTITVSGAAGSFYSTIQEESVSLTQRAILNFLGTSMTCVDNGGTLATDCTITGGSGSANGVVVSINLGTGLGLVYTVTVVGQAWVTATSAIACSPFGTTADGLTPETVMAAGVQAVTSAYVVGTGFNLSVYSPHGASGTYRFGCTGV